MKRRSPVGSTRWSMVRVRCSSAGSTRWQARRGTSGDATWKTRTPTLWSSTGERRSPFRSTGPAPPTTAGSSVADRSWSTEAEWSRWPMTSLPPTACRGQDRDSRRAPVSVAVTPCWPSSNGPAPVRCSTSSPPSRPSRTRSSAPRSTGWWPSRADRARARRRSACIAPPSSSTTIRNSPAPGFSSSGRHGPFSATSPRFCPRSGRRR